MRCLRLIIVSIFLALNMPHAYAVNPDEILPDAALEERARNISANLRCLVCQNQSIDDSDAQLARDLRILVRERISAGDSNAEVMKYVVGRYGEFVLLRPAFNGRNLVLWATPITMLMIGGFVAFTYNRRHKQAQNMISLTDEEEKRLSKLLNNST